MLLKITSALLVLYVLLLPVVQPIDFFVFGIQLQISDVVFPVVCVAFAVSVVSGQIRLVPSRLHLCIALYLAAFAISTIFSDSPGRSSLKLIGVFYLAAIALVTTQLAANEKLFKWIVLAFAAGTGLTVAAAAVGLAGFYAGFDDPRTNFLLFKFGSLPSGHYPRVQALFSNANMMCNYLNIGLMCTLLSVRLNWLPRYLGIPLVLATLAASALTISPGIGGILLSLGIWVWKDEARIPDLLFRRVILSTAVIGAVLMFAAAATSIDTPNTDLDVPIPFTHISVEPSVRALIWGTAASSALAHPIAGVGTGIDAFMVRYTALNGDQQRLTDAHNMWLNVTMQAGVIGLAALFFLIVSLWSILARSLTSSAPRDVIGLAFMCIFVGAFLYQGLAGSFEDARHLWVVFGLIGAIDRMGVEPVRTDDRV